MSWVLHVTTEPSDCLVPNDNVAPPRSLQHPTKVYASRFHLIHALLLGDQQRTDPASSAIPKTPTLMAAYLVEFFQHQRTNPSTLIFDVHLAELVPICGDGADFPSGVLVAYPVKEVIDPARRRLLKRVAWVDVDHLTIPSKVRW